MPEPYSSEAIKPKRPTAAFSPPLHPHFRPGNSYTLKSR